MNNYIKLILALIIGLGIGFSGFFLDKENSPHINKEKGIAFLAENKTKPSVITTDSGLQYEILAKGNGPSPSLSSSVKVHYRGVNIDGEEFDTSYNRQKPVSFPLNQVIAGWTEGIQLMSPGAKYRFFIPPELAYGEAGYANIPPSATLIFDVELISFK